MKRHNKYFALAAAAASLLSACSDVSPTGVEFKRQDDIVIGVAQKTYTFPVTGPNGEDVAFQYITPSGGRLKAGGHEMIVPAGAVAQPTWFLMSVIATDRIQLNLRAWRGRDWAPVTQFPATSPIELRLDVSRVVGIDLSELVLVYLPDNTFDGDKVPVRSTVNLETKILTGYLTHFSMYAVAREYTIGMDRYDNSGSGSYNSGSGSYSSGSGSGY
jgi:hypothetical protein